MAWPNHDWPGTAGTQPDPARLAAMRPQDWTDAGPKCGPDMVTSDGYCLVCGKMTYHAEYPADSMRPVATPTGGNWLANLADRFAREKFVITRLWSGDDYLTRWTLAGARKDSRFLGGRAVFLHRFHRSDPDEMHDHPWPFVSVILSGGYWERTPGPGWANGSGPVRRRWYGAGRVLVRPANWIHSVEIPAGREAYTLILRGKKVKSWGFYCPRTGYVPWRTHRVNTIRTGQGCDAGD